VNSTLFVRLLTREALEGWIVTLEAKEIDPLTSDCFTGLLLASVYLTLPVNAFLLIDDGSKLIVAH
jgi:hypothetical protein